MKTDSCILNYGMSLQMLQACIFPFCLGRDVGKVFLLLLMQQKHK
jgi:hypothetical protein